MRSSAALISVLSWIFLASTALAGPADDNPSADRVTRQLSLRDAIREGLVSNLDVEVQRMGPLIAHEAARSAEGVYDPELFAEFGYESNETPIASTLQTDPQLIDRKTDGTGGFRGLLPWIGGNYAIALSGERTTTNSSIASLSPELRSSLFFQANLPLLRGLIWNEPWSLVRSTRLLYQSAEEDFRRAVMDTVRDIEAAYWALVAAREQFGVADKSLVTARVLLDQTRTRYEVGVVSKVEVTEADAGVAERELNLINAENATLRAQDRLIDLVMGRELTATSRLDIEPTDDPEDFVVYEVDVARAVARAFAQRPELAMARRETERQQVQLRFAKNQRLPRFDVAVSYGFLGLAGEENPARRDFGAGTRDLIEALNAELGTNLAVPPPADPIRIDRSYGSTFDNYFTERGSDQFSVRGTLSIPFPNTTARRNASKATLELRRARARTRRLEQSIVLQVRDAARNLRSSQRGIEAAKRRRGAAAEQLRAERIRLQHGESTPFEVLQRERDLVDAESQHIGALRLYRTSVSELERAQGTILETHNVVIEDVRRLR